MTINKLERLHIFRNPKDVDIWDTFQKYIKTHEREPPKLDIYYGTFEGPIVVGKEIKIRRTNADGDSIGKTFQTLKVSDIQGDYIICEISIFKHSTKEI